MRPVHSPPVLPKLIRFYSCFFLLLSFNELLLIYVLASKNNGTYRVLQMGECIMAKSIELERFIENTSQKEHAK